MSEAAAVAAKGCFPAQTRIRATTLQFNLGRLCNQACLHCHVDSSPKRTSPEDNASAHTVDGALELLRREPGLQTVDLTGGAPELNPDFRRMVDGARAMDRSVLVRHNLTVQFEPGQEDLPRYFADRQVTLFCSLPCYLEDNVDRQRGNGVFARSLEALRALNRAGFGTEGGPELILVYNPQGMKLPPPQAALEDDYRRVLAEDYGVQFTKLVTITNQPIHRFREDLERRGLLEDYHQLLEDNFNAATLDGLMCRGAISLRWDGLVYDCDFNLVQDLGVQHDGDGHLTLDDLLDRGLSTLDTASIAVDRHCFACTAGNGSSCGGALVV